MRNVIILTICRLPDDLANLFNDKLNDLLPMPHQENKTMFLTGDFNINTSDAIINPNININNFQNIFKSYLYTPLIDKHTRVDKKRGTSTLLDNIYIFKCTRSPKCAAITGVGVDMSPHCFIKCPNGSASYTASGSNV